MKKCSFSIDSLLENKTPNLQISNRSYNEDTEDGSSDDGHISFRSPPISSYALFNQIKTLDMSTTTKIKADLTGKIDEQASLAKSSCCFFLLVCIASSGSESDHSPYRLNPNKHLNNNRHGINHKTKPKRIRTIFTPEQLERLESEFDKQQYMVGNERFYLATTLDLTEAQVKVKIFSDVFFHDIDDCLVCLSLFPIKVWFQNRRIKWRRQALDDHQQRITSLSGTITSTQAPPSTINDDDDDDPHSDSDE